MSQDVPNDKEPPHSDNIEPSHESLSKQKLVVTESNLNTEETLGTNIHWERTKSCQNIYQTEKDSIYKQPVSNNTDSLSQTVLFTKDI